jgi:hypothetical protein
MEREGVIEVTGDEPTTIEDADVALFGHVSTEVVFYNEKFYALDS